VVVVRVGSVEDEAAAQSANEEDIATPFFLLDVFLRCFELTVGAAAAAAALSLVPSSLFFVVDDDDEGGGEETFCVSFPRFRPQHLVVELPCCCC